MSIWNGFASPAVDAEKTVCGQLHYYEQDVIEFKSTHFRVIIRYHQYFQAHDKIEMTFFNVILMHDAWLVALMGIYQFLCSLNGDNTGYLTRRNLAKSKTVTPLAFVQVYLRETAGRYTVGRWLH